jgi:alkylhydroperoxidase family enzyme
VARIAPVSTADAIRARVPDVLRCYAETRESVLAGGIVEPALKDLCARYLAGDTDVADYEASPVLEEREKAALAWAEAVAWDSERADDALWERLQASFSEPELVELGYAIAFTLGQQHWVRTLGLLPR